MPILLRREKKESQRESKRTVNKTDGSRHCCDLHSPSVLWEVVSDGVPLVPVSFLLGAVVHLVVVFPMQRKRSAVSYLNSPLHQGTRKRGRYWVTHY